ncbi:MAG: PKD domain-containing protein, partial [Bacteroidota bacterium]|nr:PKD domain-containing protein [Bacteroidota bacterium]
CLRIEDNTGCVSELCHEVTVLGGQGDCHAAFEWDQVGNSLEVHFFDNSDDDPDIISWHWNFGDGHTSEEQNPTHTFETYGTHAVCLIVTNEFGCVSDICWEVEIQETQEGCHAAFEWQQFENTLEIHFINHSTSDHDIISWHWTFGDGQDSNDQSPNHNYAHPGTYVVCLRIEDNTGCVSEICHEVTVGGSSEGCSAAFEWEQFEDSTAIHFIDQSTSDHDIVSWLWTFGDGHSSDNHSPNHTYEEPGTYLVCLIITDNTGCVSDVCHEVTVEPAQGGFQAEFQFFQMDDPMQIVFNGSASDNQTIMSWFWDFGDGETSTEQFPTHIYTHTGTYIVCLTLVNIEGYPATTCHNMTVINDNDLCGASFKFQRSLSGNEVLFTNTSTGTTGTTTWHWEFGDGQTSGEQNPQHAYAKAGIYTVCLFIWDHETGCSSHFCHSMTYHLGFHHLNPHAQIENTHSEDTNFNNLGGGINIVSYTNPVRDHVNVSYTLDHDMEVTIEILDFMGNRVMNTNLGTEPKGLRHAALSSDQFFPGMYMIVLKAGENTVVKYMTVVD